jgi:YbbR domain-containing protein
MEKTRPVSGEYSGGIAAEGYQAEPMEFQPGAITVYGPPASVSRIETILVTVMRENLTKTLVEELPFTLLDEDGAVIDAEGLTFSEQLVTVTVPIKMVREVPLTVNLVEGAGANEKNTICKVNPETITLSGEAADMQINYILLGTIDLTGFETSITETLPIIVPNELKNLTGLTDATVTVKITGLETRQLPVLNIQMVNVPEGCEATLITQYLDVTIRGAPDDMERLQASNIGVVADLSELGSAGGAYTVPARVYVNGDFGESGAIGEYRVTVSLTEAGSDTGSDQDGT